MTRMPVVSGREAARAFERIGYAVDHQTDSHIILRQDDEPHRRLTIPDHRELAEESSVQSFATPA